MHLSYQEHRKIYSGLCVQKTPRQIALSIDRHFTTIYREIARNSDAIGYLPPAEAFERQQKKKNKRCTKIDQNAVLQKYIYEMLIAKMGPKVIAATWNKQNNDVKISHESIYSWLYKPGREELCKLLPRAKRKRGLAQKRLKKSNIPERVSIHDRPLGLADRQSDGHFEADLVFNKGSMSKNILTLIDRKSRLVTLIKNETKNSALVIGGILKHVARLAIKNITFDNGSEFTLHTKLRNQHAIGTFFCDPGSPWQKGSIEQFNGMLRRHIPFKVAPEAISQKMLDQIGFSINHTPREILGFLTPCEVFNKTFQSGNIACCVSSLT